ncbi:F-box protein [Aspergillus mulundensis]|uniref:F-box domain-containing protein n=1 Tax=Aspergillus mulundensis TaxID=1810919 RepID=A0A3D8T355_9EURO|nr:hypothetical protein DSM5745_00317 [Aspergillus mulundensis]RDW92995.1 hypothetical protein DSM5745_00317 [Aspergillus mulundensis]
MSDPKTFLTPDDDHGPRLPTEILEMVFEYLNVRDLGNCVQANPAWNTVASRKMYRGSLQHQELRTPDISSLNAMSEAFPARFTQNMSLVEHLLVSPKEKYLREEDRKWIARESFHVLRELRLAQSVSRVRSLSMPYEPASPADSQLYTSVLVTPKIEFLAIDDSFCSYLDPRRGFDSSRLKGTRALTIYSSGPEIDVDSICSMIDQCDLRFFLYEDARNRRPWATERTDQLLTCLARQKDLEVLVLLTRGVSHRLIPLMREGKPWPELKVLRIPSWITEDSDWMSASPLDAYSQLEMVDLPMYTHLNAACRDRLKMLRFEKIDHCDVRDLLHVLSGCHRLRWLSFGTQFPLESTSFASLPLLDSLEYLVFAPEDDYMHIGRPRRVATMHDTILVKCPRLTVLEMPTTHLTVSLNSLEQMPSFPNIKRITLLKVSLGDYDLLKQTYQMTESSMMEDLVAEWRRIFPNLQRFPGEPYPRKISKQTRSPLFNWTRQFVTLSRYPWKSPNDKAVELKKLQDDLETEIMGWPIVPLSSYHPNARQ